MLTSLIFYNLTSIAFDAYQSTSSLGWNEEVINASVFWVNYPACSEYDIPYVTEPTIAVFSFFYSGCYDDAYSQKFAEKGYLATIIRSTHVGEDVGIDAVDYYRWKFDNIGSFFVTLWDPLFLVYYGQNITVSLTPSYNPYRHSEKLGFSITVMVILTSYGLFKLYVTSKILKTFYPFRGKLNAALLIVVLEFIQSIAIICFLGDIGLQTGVISYPVGYTFSNISGLTINMSCAVLACYLIDSLKNAGVHVGWCARNLFVAIILVFIGFFLFLVYIACAADGAYSFPYVLLINVAFTLILNLYTAWFFLKYKVLASKITKTLDGAERNNAIIRRTGITLMLSVIFTFFAMICYFLGQNTPGNVLIAFVGIWGMTAGLLVVLALPAAETAGFSRLSGWFSGHRKDEHSTKGHVVIGYASDIPLSSGKHSTEKSGNNP